MKNKISDGLSKKIEILSEKIALKIVQAGSDTTNFKILKMLPTNTETIMNVTGLTKVPVNIRMNHLEKVGLAKRRRGTGEIILTDLGEYFINSVETFEEMITKHALDMTKIL